jgi:hypothetical protein
VLFYDFHVDFCRSPQMEFLTKRQALKILLISLGVIPRGQPVL